MKSAGCDYVGSHPTRDPFVRSASNGLAVEIDLALDRQAFFIDHQVFLMEPVAQPDRSAQIDLAFACGDPIDNSHSLDALAQDDYG